LSEQGVSGIDREDGSHSIYFAYAFINPEILVAKPQDFF